VGKHSKGKVQRIGKHRRETTKKERQREAVDATAKERDKDATGGNDDKAKE
jgi:hypothetical protein